MDKRTLTMNWDRLGDDDDDHFFESYDRISSAVPLDLDSSDEEYDDSRMSFASAVSSAAILNEMRSCSFKSSANPPSVLENYDVWMAEPGSIQDRRKRLFQGMGLNSNRDLLAISSTKFSRGVSKKVEIQRQEGNDKSKTKKSKKEPTTKPDAEKKKSNEDVPESLPTTAIVLVRSRSDGEIVSLTFDTKRRKEELIGTVSKQRLTRTSSAIMTPNVGVCQVANAFRLQGGTLRKSSLNSTALDGQIGSFFLIKNLDNGTDFIVKEYNDKGMWNKLSDLQTGKQLTIEEFEKSMGHSPVVKELMHRTSLSKNPDDEKKVAANSSFTKNFWNGKKKGAALLKNIMDVANSMSGFKGEKERPQQQIPSEQRSNKNSSSQWVKVRQNGKQYKEFTGLHMCQEIQAHEGSIWTIKFSPDACFLASAGEDRVIHVWEVQECEVVSSKPPDDMNSASSTPVHPMACSSPDRPPLPENKPTPSEKKTKGKNSSKKKGNIIPDYVNVPETVFALSERPICSFTGHQDDVLDLSWSKSQLLLSSSMDKTVRLWDMETKNCLKMFAHNDYVTCIQFNPVDDDYFLSGSLDAKIRIWNVPNRQVVDWMDVHEMVTAACYNPDGQSAVVGSHKGTCRLYSTADYKLEQKESIDIQTKKKAQPKKITGFQYNPSNPSELLIASADSRIRIFDGSDITHKFRGFRNTSSQIASSFSPDGKYVISASEDSQVYVWKREETRNAGNGKSKTIISIPSHEHFPSKDVSVAIPWPGSIKNEVPVVELHSKKHSKRTTPQSQSGTVSPTKEEVGPTNNSKAQLPPLPHKNNQSEKVTSCAEEDQDQISRSDSGIGESFSSASMRDDPSSISNSSSSLGSWSSSWSWFDVGNSHGHTVQATAWGLVIVTAGLGGEIRAYQNFGLPLKAARQTYLFRDLT